MGRKKIQDSEEIIIDIIEQYKNGVSYRKIVTYINNKYEPENPLTRYRVQKHIHEYINNNTYL